MDLKLGKKEYALLLSRRGKSYGSSNGVEDLTKKLGLIEESEMNYLAAWKQVTSTISEAEVQSYQSYSLAELITMLGLTTGHKFPVYSSFLPSSKGVAVRLVLAYYRLEGIELKPEVRLTEEQETILQNYPGLTVVNAGPGTGKTTVANRLAALKKEEGVLLVSYTNEAIRENYRRIRELPGMKGKAGLKDYGRSLNIVTADSLSHHLLPLSVKTELKKEGAGYDTGIRLAIENLRGGILLQNMRIYRHLVIDETQDIDDLRGLLLLRFFLTYGLESVTVLGDPRQRIREGCGRWYSRLWMGESLEDLFRDLDPLSLVPDTPGLARLKTLGIRRIGLSWTHRFQNLRLLEVANGLSEKRPEVHYKLQTLMKPEEMIQQPIYAFPLNSDPGYTDQGFLHFGNYLKEYLHEQKGIAYSEIAVICPSLEAQNQTSITALQCCAVFKSLGIPCYNYIQSDNFLPEGVLFTTIHSVKGKEFKVTVLLGFSGYPFPPWPIPTVEGDSLVYVAHTRARELTFYLSSMKGFVKPRHMENWMIDFAVQPTSNENNSSYLQTSLSSHKRLKISDIVSDFGFQKFMKVNNFLPQGIEEDKFDFPEVNCPFSQEPRFWGILCGLGVQMALSGRYPRSFEEFCSGRIEKISMKEYRDRGLVNGFDPETQKYYLVGESINEIKETERKEALRISKEVKPMELKWSEIVLVARLVDFLQNSHMNSRYDIELTDSVVNQGTCLGKFFQIGRALQKRYGSLLSEEYLVKNDFYVGSIDLLFKNKEGLLTVVEMKTTEKEFNLEHYYQTYLYRLLIGAEKAVVVNLANGKSSRIESTRTEELWSYTLAKLAEIKKQHENNFMWGKPLREFTEPTFVVDTEYIAHNKRIFDLACYNLADPYLSLVSPLQLTDPEEIHQACDWLGAKPDLFLTAPSLPEFRDRLVQMVNTYSQINRTRFYYYNSPVDCGWLNPGQGIPIDVKEGLSKIAKKFGTFVGTSSFPKLSDVYEMISYPLNFQPHLSPHTAISDCCMLAELILVHQLEIPNL